MEGSHAETNSRSMQVVGVSWITTEECIFVYYMFHCACFVQFCMFYIDVLTIRLTLPHLEREKTSFFTHLYIYIYIIIHAACQYDYRVSENLAQSLHIWTIGLCFIVFCLSEQHRVSKVHMAVMSPHPPKNMFILLRATAVLAECVIYLLQ